ncbi:MAG: hypothetical protein HY236_12485 [Acidobacteria bacterium]|nr:hypothetical protein [Acidobacteriota bacterium]
MTSTPEVNVDLFVRFGAPPTAGTLGVVAEYASTGPTGNETITVTRDSSPPLRPGVYFLGLGLFPTQVEVTGTILAVVD